VRKFLFVLHDFIKVLQVSCLLSLPLWLCSVSLLTLPVVIAIAIKMKLLYTRLSVAKWKQKDSQKGKHAKRTLLAQENRTTSNMGGFSGCV
jgi:hypothetical protein